jgi:hypothetical protein
MEMVVEARSYCYEAEVIANPGARQFSPAEEESHRH